MNRISLGLLWIGLCAQSVFSQAESRSGQSSNGFPAFSPTSGVPCAGTALFSDDFEAGIGTWSIVDGDSLTPNSAMGLAAGWQLREDYRDSSNQVAVSPSWYSPVGQSDDWLISPAVVLGSNPCLSWVAYSQDIVYLESYEVRVSTTNDTAAFLANPAVATVSAETYAPNQRAASLAAYAGQTVFIAFRQTSNDKFVLALDDIKVSNVNVNDIGVTAFDAPTSDPGDTLTFTLQVANYGSDTVRSFEVRYSVEGGPIRLMTLDSLTLAPNGTYTFDHSTEFISDTVEAFYDFCAWTSVPNGVADEEISNDSLCDRFKVGTPVGIAPAQFGGLGMTVFPNPASGQVTVLLEGIQGNPVLDMQLVDLNGRVLWQESRRVAQDGRIEWSPKAQYQGIYFLHIQSADGRKAVQKLIFE